MRRRLHHVHKLEKSRDHSTSSSMTDDQLSENKERSVSASSSHSVNDNSRRPRRRRRKRKSTTETSKDSTIRQKIIAIEKALVHLDEEVSESFSEDDGTPRKRFGRAQLKGFAVSEGGLLNDDLRKKVWPRLLNIDLVETSMLLSDDQVKENKNYHQVLMDVNRSLKRFPPGIAEEDRPELQDQLTRLIIRVLDKHPELHYYQGYHDVAITFLLVVGEEMSFHILERLSTGPWLREFMHPTMERTTYLLNFIYPIIEGVDKELYEFMDASEVGTIFALPWLITWFGHVLPDYSDVVRLYDFFLAQPPMMAVYVAAAIVLHRSIDIKQTECDMASVHGLLSGIPLESPPFEYLLTKANDLYEQFPPAIVKSQVDERMKRLLRQDFALVDRKKSSPSVNYRSTIRKLVIAAAPVMIGVFFYVRFVQNQYF